MWDDVLAYASAVIRAWIGWVTGSAFAAIIVIASLLGLPVPKWFWLPGLIVGVMVSQFLAWNIMRTERDAARSRQVVLRIEAGNAQQFNVPDVRQPSRETVPGWSDEQVKRYLPRAGWECYAKVLKVVNESSERRATGVRVRVTATDPPAHHSGTPFDLLWLNSDSYSTDISPGDSACVVMVRWYIHNASGQCLIDAPAWNWTPDHGPSELQVETWADNSTMPIVVRLQLESPHETMGDRYPEIEQLSDRARNGV
ncbi:MAG: hypothetical protein ACR2KK_08835 [Acidimicrobiales bacterium]